MAFFYDYFKKPNYYQKPRCCEILYEDTRPGLHRGSAWTPRQRPDHTAPIEPVPLIEETNREDRIRLFLAEASS
jgi:hypothetical protein